MKKVIICCLALLAFVNSRAQSSRSNADDAAKIALSAYVPDQAEKMPEIARGMLTNKLSQIATANGMAGNAANQRFIITANIVVLTKDLTETAPPMTALTLEVSLYIGDGIDGIKFASTTLQVKGVGTNENKAYISALKNINAESPVVQGFVTMGKNKIVQYYNTHCSYIMNEAKGLVNQERYDEALYKLTSVPEICKDCYTKTTDAVGPIYKKAIDHDCQTKLTQARSTWAANQTVDGANAAGDILSGISPNAAGYSNVKVLIDQMAKKMKELDQRDWNYQLKEQKQEGDIIQAARDVAVAYAQNQPQTFSYNVVGWW